jgi:hypothetical protein
VEVKALTSEKSGWHEHCPLKSKRKTQNKRSLNRGIRANPLDRFVMA